MLVGTLNNGRVKRQVVVNEYDDVVVEDDSRLMMLDSCRRRRLIQFCVYGRQFGLVILFCH